MRALIPLIAGTAFATGCVEGKIGDLAPSGDNPTNPTNPNTPPPVPPGTPGACANVARDVGRVTIHRLNRSEYNNTMRDLLLLDERPADDFPPDDHGYGFDNNADVLSIAPALFEKYDLAAETLLDLALEYELSASRQQFEAEVVTSEVGGPFSDYGWNLWANGEITRAFSISADGEYEISARAFGSQAGPDPAQMTISIDGRLLATLDVPQTEANPAVFSARATLTAGAHTFSVAFINDFYEPPADRNLIVDWVAVEGPIGGAGGATRPEAYARIMICDPMTIGRDPCMSSIIDSFARRAWRRPVTGEELNRLVALSQIAEMEGDTFIAGVKLALHAVLILRPVSLTRSISTSSPRASLISCGARCPTTACSPRRRKARSTCPPKFGACSVIQRPVRWSTTSPASGSTRARSTMSSRTIRHIRTSTSS
jgi:hypothetical protein